MSRFHQNCWKLLETNQESLLGHVTLRVRFHTLGCIIIRNMYVHVRECINPLTLPAAARLKRPPSCGCTPRSQYWGRRTAFHSRDIQLRVLLGEIDIVQIFINWPTIRCYRSPRVHFDAMSDESYAMRKPSTNFRTTIPWGNLSSWIPDQNQDWTFSSKFWVISKWGKSLLRARFIHINGIPTSLVSGKLWNIAHMETSENVSSTYSYLKFTS